MSQTILKTLHCKAGTEDLASFADDLHLLVEKADSGIPAEASEALALNCFQLN